jgi:hypothetical protein
MTKYREILRLYSHRISKSGIAASCGCARKTVTKVLDRAKELNITWPLNQEMTDGELEKMFFPKPAVSPERHYPDLEYIHKELIERRRYS